MITNPFAVQHLLKVAGPSLAIAAAYLLLVHLPLQRERTQLDNKLKKQISVANRADFQAERKRLALVQEEIAGLTTQLTENQELLSHYISKGKRMAGGMYEPKAPASAIADLLSIMQRNGLRCNSTLPIPSRETRTREAIPAVAERASQRSDQPASEMQIQVSGTFQAMQAALGELAASSIASPIVSLDMADAVLTGGEISNKRSWTVTVDLDRSQP